VTSNACNALDANGLNAAAAALDHAIFNLTKYAIDAVAAFNYNGWSYYMFYSTATCHCGCCLPLPAPPIGFVPVYTTAAYHHAIHGNGLFGAIRYAAASLSSLAGASTAVDFTGIAAAAELTANGADPANVDAQAQAQAQAHAEPSDLEPASPDSASASRHHPRLTAHHSHHHA
jgi:hypothetical protein